MHTAVFVDYAKPRIRVHPGGSSMVIYSLGADLRRRVLEDSFQRADPRLREFFGIEMFCGFEAFKVELGPSPPQCRQ